MSNSKSKIFIVERYVDRKSKNWWLQYIGLDESGNLVRFRWGEFASKTGDAYIHGFVFTYRSMAERFLEYLKNMKIIKEEEEFYISEQLGSYKDKICLGQE